MKNIEDKILNTIKNNKIPLTMSQIIYKIRINDSSIFVEDLKQAAWRLIDRGTINISNKLKLVIPERTDFNVNKEI